jgi:Histidine kinase-like ATPase domain
VRRSVRRGAGPAPGWRGPERDELLSVASELAGNSLLHTASGDPGGSFTVEVAWRQSTVHVAVTDGGSLGEPRVIEDPDGEHGRGLLLVHGLSARTGWAGDERGRVVWAQIAWPDNAGIVPDAAGDLRQVAARGNQVALVQPFADGAHPAAHCCCHLFTPTCPVDCLAAVLSTATFHALARADGAPFEPPATVGQVLELRRTGQLSKAAGLGRRRLGEIDAACSGATCLTARLRRRPDPAAGDRRGSQGTPRQPSRHRAVHPVAAHYGQKQHGDETSPAAAAMGREDT